MKTNFIYKDNFDCIVCGNKKFKYLFSDFDNYVKATKKKFSIFKCLKCELIEIDPKISENNFDIYYPQNYNPYNIEIKKKSQFRIFIKKLRDTIINLLHIDRVKLELSKFEDFEKKYLDFGSGNSRHLSHIKDQYPKWILYGYDKSEFAKKNLIENNFNLIDSLENVPDSFFDIINLSSVIEHLEQPSKDLNMLKKKLKPGGIIIIKTPNWKSLGRVFFRKNWINYDIPRHIHVFSSKNLKKFLVNNKFEIVKLIHSNNISVELKSIYRLLKLRKRPKFHSILTKLFLPIGVILNLTSLSSTITVIGKKND